LRRPLHKRKSRQKADFGTTQEAKRRTQTRAPKHFPILQIYTAKPTTKESGFGFVLK